MAIPMMKPMSPNLSKRADSSLPVRGRVAEGVVGGTVATGGGVDTVVGDAGMVLDVVDVGAAVVGGVVVVVVVVVVGGARTSIV